MEELRSWWEVPAIAHFFSLFKSCFAITDFTIEELEEALLADCIDEKSTFFTSQLVSELLQGCFDNPNITVTTCHDWLRQIMHDRWEEQDKLLNPLSVPGADFHNLPTRLKVQIIHRLTEYRLDGQDVAVKLAGLNPSDLRLDPLGSDRHGARYWYFFGVRLYKETPTPNVDKNHNIKCKKIRGKWSVVCYNVGDWQTLAKSLKGSTSKREKQLRQLVKDNFLPNLPKIVEDMEQQQLMKMQTEPKRSSCRILAKKICKEEEDAEAVRDKQKQDALKKERVEHNRLKREEGGERMCLEFDHMLRAELERKWRLDEKSRRMEFHKKRVKEVECGRDAELSSSEDELPIVENKVISYMITPRIPPKAPPKKRGPKKKIFVNRKAAVKPRRTSKQPSSSDESDSNDELHDKMNDVIQALSEYPESWQFANPVEESYAPGYYSIIKRPMDLATIEQKIKERTYTDITQFTNDVELMFANCRLYNGPDSEYTEVANDMDHLFRENLRKIIPTAVKFLKCAPKTPPTQNHDEFMDSDSPENINLVGATTRATWRELTTDKNPTPTRGRKRKAPAKRGRKPKQQQQQAQLQHTPRRRGRPTRRSIPVESSQSNQSSEEEDESKAESDKEVIENDSPEKSSNNISQDVSMEQSEREKTDDNDSEENKTEQTIANERTPTPKHASPKPKGQRSPSSSSSRGSSLDKFNQLEQESRVRPQVVWSLDFLASQAKVLEEQQNKEKSGTSADNQRKNNVIKPPNSVENEEKSTYPAYPMTPGFHRPEKEHRRASQESPPTPSSGYSSYRAQGMSGPPSLNPPTPKLSTVDENRIYDDKLRQNNHMLPESRFNNLNSVDVNQESNSIKHNNLNNHVADKNNSSVPKSITNNNVPPALSSKNVPHMVNNDKHQITRENASDTLHRNEIISPKPTKPPPSHNELPLAPRSVEHHNTGQYQRNSHMLVSRAESVDTSNMLKDKNLLQQNNHPVADNQPPRRASLHEPPPSITQREIQNMKALDNQKKHCPPPHQQPTYQQNIDNRISHPTNPPPATNKQPSTVTPASVQRRNSDIQRSNRSHIRNTMTTTRQQPTTSYSQTSRFQNQRTPTTTTSMQPPYNYSKADTPIHRAHAPAERVSQLPGGNVHMEHNPNLATVSSEQKNHPQAEIRNHEAPHDISQSVASIFLNNPTMSSLGLNWSLTQQQTHGAANEHHKSHHAGLYDPMTSHTTTPQSSEHSSAAQSKKRSSYQSNEYYHYPTQQSSLLPGSNPLLHHTAEMAASARLSRVLQQQHKADGSMLAPYGTTPSTAEQYNRLAQAQQHHPLGMYHQSSTATAQNPWGLPPALHPPIDPLYQHYMYRNLLHKY